MSESRMVIASNRLPVSVKKDKDGLHLQPSCGGLVTALSPILGDAGGSWIGWTGTDHDPAIVDLLRDYSASNSYSVVPVFLTATEKAEFYDGCCNQIIWPLFHDLQSRCDFNPMFWDAYLEVSNKFADTIEVTTGKGDFVWVHDYHLMMVAEALEERELRVKLGYFHHIPFPTPDIFEKLPWRSEILRGLLRFNVVGFQTARDRQNFVASVRRFLRNAQVQQLGENLLVGAAGLCTSAGVFPISIDYEDFAARSAAPDTETMAETIQRSTLPTQIVLGIDRLDYTKGIPERLLAFEMLLRDYPEVRGLISMIQVVVPSRADIANYRELKLLIERLVSGINGEYAQPGWVPVHYYYRCLSPTELLAFYRAADIALITPLKDGMNLVAKEFCASRVNNDGVLILSEFAGAAAQLRCGALLVNPNDVRMVASALYRGFRMSGREQCVRMRRMQHHLRRNDVFRWRDSFCAQARVRRPRETPSLVIATGAQPTRTAVSAVA